MVLPPGAGPGKLSRSARKPYVDDGTVFNSAFLDGLSVAEAKRAAGERLEKLGPRRAHDRLSPARLGRVAPALLGLPIPIVHCAKCGIVPVPESELPVTFARGCQLRPAGQPA